MLELGGEGGGGAVVGVEDEEPGVAVGEGEAEVAVGGVVVEGALGHVGAEGPGDGDCGVGGMGVEDVNVVGKGYGAEGSGEVEGLVLGEDEDGKHAVGMIAWREQAGKSVLKVTQGLRKGTQRKARLD